MGPSSGPSSMYKRFHGSSFLSDFTLSIEFEGASTLYHALAGQASQQGLDQLPMSGNEAFSTPVSSPRSGPQPGDTLTCSISVRSGPSAAPPGLSPSCTLEHTTAYPSQHLQQQQLQQQRGPSACGDTATPTPTTSSVACTLPVHGVVLAAASSYFETLLKNWTGESDRTIHMCVGEEQLQAAKALISFMYQAALPAGLPQHDLYHLLLLADRFDVRHCFEAAARSLGALSASELEWDTLLALTSLPDHLYETEPLAAARAVAAERQQQLFGDLEVVWASGDGRGRWRQLPFRAVAQLAASDALSCSENTLFAALTAWVAAAGAAAGAEELKTLAASVRVPLLTPCYLSYVVMQHPWYVSAISPLLLARAAAFAAAPEEVRKDLLAAAASLGTHAAAATAAAAPIDLHKQQSGTHGPSSSAGGGGSSSGGMFAGGSGSAGQGGLQAVGQPVDSMYRAALAGLSAAQMRCRLGSIPRSCSFNFLVELSRVQQLLEQVAAAGSRENRTIRSPAHFFGGYEWALQLEITQTKGAVGFDQTKPWALGVFLTCQVRSEVPGAAAVLPLAAGGAQPAVDATAATSSSSSSSAVRSLSGRQPSASSSVAGAPAGGGSAVDGSAGGDVAAVAAAGAGSSSSQGPLPPAVSFQQQQQQQQQQQAFDVPAALSQLGLGGGGSSSAATVLQPLDYGFVTTAATISAREVAGGRDKRWERSWEHAMVRHRASWGWPNYLDISVRGWEEAAFERWAMGGALHLTAAVKLLGLLNGALVALLVWNSQPGLDVRCQL